jgi:predicted RNA binding protein YcfA (HicA-like mRNA interferase family)
MAQMFAYTHESFHHSVEMFATRLEITHRQPLYRTAFLRLYQRQVGTDDALEEALASAHAYRRVKSRAFRTPNEPAKRKAVLAVLAGYIEESGPGYDRAMEWVDDSEFYYGRASLAEVNHEESLPHLPGDMMDAWFSFPHAFGGMTRINGRVNYLVHRDSPLAQRVPVRGHFLRYRRLQKLLREHGCRFLRQGRGGHEIWANPSGSPFPVARHPREFTSGTLRAIIREAGLGLSISEFVSG